FIDLGGEVNELNTYVLEAVHQVMLVLTPTASAVQDTYRAVETLRRLGHRRKLRLVLNQAGGAFAIEEMVSDLQAPLAAVIPHDDAFAEAESDHRPASLGEGRRSIVPLANALFPGFGETPPRRSLWRRLWERVG